MTIYQNPVDMLGAVYSDYYRTCADPDSPQESRNQMVRSLSAFLLGRESGVKILDIGSGTRQVEQQLIRVAKGYRDPTLRKKIADAQMVSFDIAAVPTRKLRSTRHVMADSRAMPFKDKTFDAAFSNLSIDMLRRGNQEDFQTALQQMSRVVKIGGEVLLHYHPYTLFYGLSESYAKTQNERKLYFNNNPEDNPFYETHDEIVDDLAEVGITVDAITFEQDKYYDSWWKVAGTKTEPV